MNKLRKIRIKEVSVVDKGANPGAKVTLYKRDEGNDMDPNLSLMQRLAKFFGFTKAPMPGAKPVDLSQVLAKLPPEDKALLLEALEAAGVPAAAPAPAPGQPLAPGAQPPMNAPAPEQPPAQDPKAPPAKADEPPAPGKQPPAAPAPGTAPTGDVPDEEKEKLPMGKSDEEFAKVAGERDALAKRLADLESVEKRRTFTAKAEGFKHLPGASTAELADLLMKVADKLDAADAAKLDGVLKSASELIAKGAAITEQGSGAPGESVAKDGKEAHGKLEGIARDLLSKGQAKTFEKAYTLACERNPSLYEQANTR